MFFKHTSEQRFELAGRIQWTQYRGKLKNNRDPGWENKGFIGLKRGTLRSTYGNPAGPQIFMVVA